MKISVITACYNGASTLERNLRSVAFQSYKSVEHIVIDGGSTDGGVEILACAQSSIMSFISESDAGIYDGMNKGIDRSEGDIICFLNADDYYAHSSVLSHVVQRMVDKGVDALMGDVVFFNKTAPDCPVRRYRSKGFSASKLAWGWMPAHPALFFHRRVFDRVGKFNINYRIAGDFEFVVRAFSEKSIKYDYLPEVLVCMQMGGVSSSGWRSKVLLNQEVLRACRENGLRTNMLKILSKYPAKLLELI